MRQQRERVRLRGSWVPDQPARYCDGLTRNEVDAVEPNVAAGDTDRQAAHLHRAVAIMHARRSGLTIGLGDGGARRIHHYDRIWVGLGERWLVQIDRSQQHTVGVKDSDNGIADAAIKSLNHTAHPGGLQRCGLLDSHFPKRQGRRGAGVSSLLRLTNWTLFSKLVRIEDPALMVTLHSRNVCLRNLG